MRCSHQRSRGRLALALGLAVAATSCTDAIAPAALFDIPVVPEAPPSTEILGGTASIEAAAGLLDRLEAEGRLHEFDPVARDMIREAARGAAPALAPSYSTTDGAIAGPYDLDGETYYEQYGEMYPASGRPAVILQQKTTGVLEPGFAQVTAVFQYEGHNATQTTSWTVSDLHTGTVLRHQPHTTFGSKVDHFFGFIRYFSGTARIFDLPQCNLLLEADSMHEAWWNGWWEFADEGTAGTNGILGIRIVRSKKGTDRTSSAIEPAMSLRCETHIEECEAEYDDDDDEEENWSDGLDRSRGSTRDASLGLAPTGPARYSCDGFGDEETCTICQQWFTIWRTKIVAEWWECWEGSGGECLMT